MKEIFLLFLVFSPDAAFSQGSVDVLTAAEEAKCYQEIERSIEVTVAQRLGAMVGHSDESVFLNFFNSPRQNKNYFGSFQFSAAHAFLMGYSDRSYLVKTNYRAVHRDDSLGFRFDFCALVSVSAGDCSIRDIDALPANPNRSQWSSIREDFRLDCYPQHQQDDLNKAFPPQ